MNWRIEYLDEATEDYEKLDGSQKILVRKAIKRALQNPLPHREGGYGIELGHKGANDLSGFLEIKLRGPGLRVIYKLVRTDTEMLVIVIGAREDEEAYGIAHERIIRHGL